MNATVKIELKNEVSMINVEGGGQGNNFPDYPNVLPERAVFGANGNRFGSLQENGQNGSRTYQKFR
jgi:hypothetical protein